MLQPIFEAVIYYKEEYYPVKLEELWVYEGKPFYYFEQVNEDFPICLEPNGSDNLMSFGLYFDSPFHVHDEYTPYAFTNYKMDPDVIVLPVYTWRFVDPQGYGANVDLTAVRYAFDKAFGTNRPEEYKNNHWASERVDQLWCQCKIQFRHMEHFEVPVPDCWVWGVYYHYWPARCRYCTPGENVTEQELNQCNSYPECLLSDYIDYHGHYIPESINIYFLGSLAHDDYSGEAVPGATCNNWIFLNDTDRGVVPGGKITGRVIAHEIGHILGLDHESGTLMAEYVSFTTNILNEEQCLRARTHNDVILNSKLESN